jgi:hypothetical protein
MVENYYLSQIPVLLNRFIEVSYLFICVYKTTLKLIMAFNSCDNILKNKKKIARYTPNIQHICQSQEPAVQLLRS